MIFQINKDRTC